MFDIRKSISTWIKPDEEDNSENWSINRDNPEYEFNENGSIEQDAKKNMEKREADDKYYPPETE